MPELLSWYFSAGDGPFYFRRMLEELSYAPRVFDGAHELGVNLVNRFWYDFPFTLTVSLLSGIGLPWGIIDKILWVSVIVLAILSVRKFLQYVGIRDVYAAAGAAVYVSNTYALMVFGGGQYGVSLAYALGPLVAGRIMVIIAGEAVGRTFLPLTVLLFSVMIAVDIRFGFMVGVLAVAFVLYKGFSSGNVRFGRNTARLGIPVIAVILAQSYWILPLITSAGGLGSEEYSGSGIVSFLSFADFPHTVSLLHPNWPENLFGRIYFMQPEFLLIPIVAYASYIFLSPRLKSGSHPKNQSVLFFTFLALAGAFLAKGANGPFGSFYVWMFEHVPGFVMFRDPTKFYFFVALAYSALIPYTIKGFTYLWASGQNKPNRKQFVIPIVFMAVWIFTIRPLWLGGLGGNFKPRQIPVGYQQIADMLSADNRFYRTLWIPQSERMAYATRLHPAVSGEMLFRNATSSAIARKFAEPGFSDSLTEKGIRYVVISDDIERKAYLSGYEHDPAQKERLIASLDTFGYQRAGSITGTVVYELQGHKPLVTTASGDEVPVEFFRDGGIGFSLTGDEETITVRYGYDPDWTLVAGGTYTAPRKTHHGTMEFAVSGAGNRRLEFVPTRNARAGVAVSAAAYVAIIFWVSFEYIKQRRIV
jgi:hypothetical protein